jgi:hypothetical protein
VSGGSLGLKRLIYVVRPRGNLAWTIALRVEGNKPARHLYPAPSVSMFIAALLERYRDPLA